MKNSFSTDASRKPALAALQEQAHKCLITVSGDWVMGAEVPAWKEVAQQCHASKVLVAADSLGAWDSALLLFLLHGRSWCLAHKKTFDVSALPAAIQRILQHTENATHVKARHQKQRAPFRFFLGNAVMTLWKHSAQALGFVGNCTLGLMRLVVGKAKWRWIDFFVEMQRCWNASLLIVSLISFLVGVILAFQSAIQLKQYGASIFVADLVGLAVVREMGPMMAAIVVAGSTGAGFAAQLGNMKVDEEIDALETLGISSIDFLVLPRFLAVTIMMPLLALYANVLGILGGLFISATMLSIPASAYLMELHKRVSFTDVTSGLVKSFVFGILIALAGCLRGIYCERTTAGVGKATSSAVVTGIMLIILADALFAVIYNALHI